jgi:hypothetical protein
MNHPQRSDMPTPSAFLQYVARAVLHALDQGAGGDFAAQLPDLARRLWGDWGQNRPEAELQYEIQAVAQLTPQEARSEAEAVVNDVAGGRPPEVKQRLLGYLSQVPAVLRQALGQPAADTTTPFTPPPLREPLDLPPLLPPRLPFFQPGARPAGIGDWELTELLGMGGFGEVWKACNPLVRHATPVALKFCLNPTAAKVLRHEASILDRVMGQGKHPGIVELRHSYLGADPPCLEYEYVPGGDLAALIRQWHSAAGSPRERTLFVSGVLHQLASILAFPHQLDPPIVHRDLKPANILVQIIDGAYQLRVTDFGIGGVAAQQAIAQEQAGQIIAPHLTAAVRGACTPLYASPQQKRGEAPDPRDDVHALGVLWFQMLTGQLASGVPGGLFWMKELREMGLSEELLVLLASCFEPLPAHRPDNAAELAEQLGQLLGLDEKAASEGDPGTTTVTPVGPLTLTVCSMGRGQYRTISEAVRDAPPGSLILVQPGLYQEGLVLDRTIEIQGDGAPDDIILQNSDGACLSMQTDYAVVRGISIHGRGGLRGRKYFAVDVPEGRLVLEDCNITSDSLACVAIHGLTADPILRRCTIHDGKSVGVAVSGNARGTLEDCTITSNHGPGVQIQQGANPTLFRCQIHDGRASGVHVHRNGKGTLKECEIHANASANMIIEEGGNPTVRRCRIHDGQQAGVLVSQQGLGSIEDCDIYRNTSAGLEIQRNGAPSVRRCRIQRNQEYAIWAHDNGAGIVENCDLSGNENGAWLIEDNSTVQRAGNRR